MHFQIVCDGKQNKNKYKKEALSAKKKHRWYFDILRNIGAHSRYYQSMSIFESKYTLANSATERLLRYLQAHLDFACSVWHIPHQTHPYAF